VTRVLLTGVGRVEFREFREELMAEGLFPPA
jgi:hypothetical protein